MHITVTGATGHIGNNMIRHLVQDGFEVRAVYRNRDKSWIFDSLSLEHCTGDILDAEFVKEAFHNTDAVIHLAGIISIEGDPDGMVHKTNTIGVMNVVNACQFQKVKKLIHFSSIHAFKLDIQVGGIIDESMPSADNTCMAYDHSKAAGEAFVIEAIRNGLDAYILHPTGVIGPHDYFNALSGIFLKKLFSGTLPALLNGGFDWVDVRDVCIATGHILKLDENNTANIISRRYILSGHFATLKDIATRCSSISIKRKPRMVFSKSLAKFGLPFIKMWAKISGSAPIYTLESINTLMDHEVHFSHHKALLELDYHPRTLDETLQDCYQWYKENGMI